MDNIFISVGGALALITWGWWQNMRRIRKVESQIPTDTVGNETIENKLIAQRDSLQQEFGVMRANLEKQIRELGDKNTEQGVKIANLQTQSTEQEKKINSLNQRIVELTDQLDTEKEARKAADIRAAQAEKEKAAIAETARAEKADFDKQIAVLGAKLEVLTKVIENPAPVRFVIERGMIEGDNKTVANEQKEV